ncbi:MAG: hypothetical protein ACLP6Z_00040 [Steroidobacteraceae bacterium]
MARFNSFRFNAWYQRCGALALVLFGLACAHPAQALPLFARQTGMACLACHTVYPELTHFGRMFKLNGYQLDNGKDLQMITNEDKQTLALPVIPNLALFVMTSYTSIGKALPDSQVIGAHSLSDTTAFPQQVSLLWGGKIAPHFGAFAQVTYDDAGDTFNIDNTDLRFANAIVLPNGQPFTYGVSLTNNPSVEDPWNTTPAFGFPYLPPESFVPSVASPIIEAGQAYQVAGPVFYALWNEQLYAAFGFFREARNGSNSIGNPITGLPGPVDSNTAAVLDGNNPYWRLSYEYDIDRYALMVGTYGLHFKLFPGAGTPLFGEPNTYTDVAGDFQFQFIGENNTATLKGTYVKENQSLGGSAAVGASNPDDWLSYTTVDFVYWYKRRYGFDVGFTSIKGSTDPLAYPSAPTLCVAGGGGACGVAAGTPGAFPVGVMNSANSNPTTDAFIGELYYAPWLNVKIGLQYTSYSKFNGGKDNYDGCAGVCASGGRNASNNNVTYLYMWFAL